MSKIILPNGNGTGPRSLKRGSDFVTMDEIVKLLGPQAVMLMELHERLREVECRFHIGYEQDDADRELQGPNLSGDMD